MLARDQRPRRRRQAARGATSSCRPTARRRAAAGSTAASSPTTSTRPRGGSRTGSRARPRPNGAGRGRRTAASSTTARRRTPTAQPWSERKKLVWWDEEQGEVDRATTSPDFDEREAARLPAARRRDGPGRDSRRPPVHHAGRRARLALRPAGPEDGPLPDALRAARVAVRNPLYAQRANPARQRNRAARGPVQPADAGRGYPYVVDHLPPDRAPHGRRHVALGAVPRRAAAGDVRRGASRTSRASAGSSTAAGRRSSTARSAIEARVLVTRPHAPVRRRRPRRAPGRPAVPLGPARADDGRRGERPRAHGARPERAHPGGQGVHVRHPAGAAAARPRSCAQFVATYGGRCGRVSDRAATDGEDAQPRVGFFTDTTVCIGCKACEVACKEWNLLPEDGLELDRAQLRQHRRARREHLAARRVRRAGQAAEARRRDSRDADGAPSRCAG